METHLQCGTMAVHHHLLRVDPDYASARARSEERHLRVKRGLEAAARPGITVIPVVVHVVWKTESQNISDAQIRSQIAVLNKDFRKLNDDIVKVPAPFAPLAGDARIEFELATMDPSGQPTNGITRTKTTVDVFEVPNFATSADPVKAPPTGASAWPRDRYLNIWVCQLETGTTGTVGYATLPGAPADLDGVVIRHNAFGTVGTVAIPFPPNAANLGRTTTHEVGHWLNLHHIWGPAEGCGIDDGVDDTPLQDGPRVGGGPAFPAISCNNGPHGDMFMNYMDSTDDAFQFLFTHGQVERMQTCLVGDRPAIGFYEMHRLLNRTALARSPKAAAPPTACVIPSLGVHNIAYRDGSGHLHELWRGADTRMGTTDLTANAHAPKAAGNPFSYVDTNTGHVILLFRGDDNIVRSLYWSLGAVGHDDLGGTAGAPKAAGNPVGYFYAPASVHQVIYRSGDNHLHDLFWVGVAPVQYGGNLTKAIGAPLAQGDPSGYVNTANGENIVVYRAANKRIMSIYWKDGPSGLDDLSGTAGTPEAAGDPVAYYTAHDDAHQVVYRGGDGHLYELLWYGVAPVAGWDLSAQSGAPKATGKPSAYYSAGTNTKHVIYRSSDGRLHEIWWTPGGTPAHVDLTAFAGAPTAASDPVAFTVEGPNTQHVAYRGTDGHIYEIRWA